MYINDQYDKHFTSATIKMIRVNKSQITKNDAKLYIYLLVLDPM